MTLVENSTEVTAFLLLGVTDDPHLRLPLFLTFLLIYTITVLGNLGKVQLILLDPRMDSPMYFFLGNLELVGFGYSSAVTPTVKAGLLRVDQVISYSVCVAQMFVFAVFTNMENILLAAMAYHRYAAVCKPLHYASEMTTTTCAWLIVGCYVISLLSSSTYIEDTFSLSFCKSNIVHHFFCDIPAIMVLSCSDRHYQELVLVYVVSYSIFFALLIVCISYSFIFITILRMRSVAGHRKAFCTCASHLTAVSIFYGTVIFMYLQPSSSHSMDTDKIASVFHTMVIPMLNPMVYSLRNKEVNSAFLKLKSRLIC